MTDPFWSISLGRWLGLPVRVHFLLIAFALFQVLGASLSTEVGGGGPKVVETVGWLCLLGLALALHEFGHAAVARRFELEPDDIQLWPLGNLTRPAHSGSRGMERLAVALAGLVTSLALALIMAAGIWLFWDAVPVWNPFGGPKGGAPLVRGQPGETVQAFTTVWWMGWFGYLNWVIFLANLIPAMPLDGGRVLRAVLAGTRSAWGRDSLVEPWTARTCAAVLALVGLVRLAALTLHPSTGSTRTITGALMLIALAGLVEWFTRTERSMVEDDGFFEDGVFGYDFSEGYTSLEAAAPKVRPKHESALRRWRRKRSEVRRLRKEAREAAEVLRLDEILEKLHREGRGALSDEENRFLVRMSQKMRDRLDPGLPPH